MSPILHINNKGISLVEAMIAFFLASTAILAAASMQSMAIWTAATADYRGRAAEIVQAEAANREAAIMTQGALIPADFINQEVVVDNISFRVTTVTAPTPPLNPNSWVLRVTVTWPPGNVVNSLTNNKVITKQMGY